MKSSPQFSFFGRPETAWRRQQVLAPPAPRDIGAERGQQAEDRAVMEVNFDVQKAASDAVAWLLEGGQASGEEIVDHLKALGHRPHDDRAFGPMFARLVREELISFVGYAVRQKGHGTSGAKVWKATGKREIAKRALTRAETAARKASVSPSSLPARYIEMRRFMRVACGERYGDEIERWQAMIVSASKFQTNGDVLAAAEWLLASFRNTAATT
jgi:hypothetical protein